MKTRPRAQIMELVSGNHSIGQNLYHLEWYPKYRYNMFRGKKNKKLCEDILHEVAERYHILMIELSVMPDHIHTFVQLPPTMSVSKALQLLKGASPTSSSDDNPYSDIGTHAEAFGAQENSTAA